MRQQKNYSTYLNNACMHVYHSVSIVGLIGAVVGEREGWRGRIEMRKGNRREECSIV